MKFKEWLEENEEENTLKSEVLEELKGFETLEEAKDFLNDLTTHGCVSGMIGKLIYYKDTNDFYDKYEDEIEDLLEELGYKNRFEAIQSLNGSENVGSIEQEKNLLSWFGFEQTGFKILGELEELKEE